jgi:uridine kinase
MSESTLGSADRAVALLGRAAIASRFEERELNGLSAIVQEIADRRERHPPGMALLVGLSGIDGSGKGYVAGRLVAALIACGLRAEVINLDGWLNLPPVRFDPGRPAENFYENALRLDQLFARLVMPLRSTRSARVAMDFAEETATSYRPHTYEFEDLDVIILEGAYLFKRAYRGHFDLAVWIDCSWETALERAIARAQEGLPPDETVRAYRTIYFPAEEIHLARDDPRGSADLILPNDPRLDEREPAGSPARREVMAEDRGFLAETETTVPIVHPPGSGKVVGVLGGQSTFKVLSEQTGGAYAVLEQQVPPGHGPPLHVHRHETEIFYILEGRFEVTLGDRTVEAPAGAMAVGPRDIPHTFRNVGPTPGKLLLTVIPGRFSNYFFEVDDLPDKDLDTIKALCAKYDVEVLE